MIFKNNTQIVLSFQVFACTRVGGRWKRGHGDTEEQEDGEVRAHKPKEKPEVGLGRTKLGRKGLLRFFPFPSSAQRLQQEKFGCLRQAAKLLCRKAWLQLLFLSPCPCVPYCPCISIKKIYSVEVIPLGHWTGMLLF
ncbi:hypothetical protein NIES25_37850 [Nostoc linckia NIES-25]|nr:hypothetical protein NIES25_37850 [Nostoc linckia NIES-25]